MIDVVVGRNDDENARNSEADGTAGTTGFDPALSESLDEKEGVIDDRKASIHKESASNKTFPVLLASVFLLLYIFLAMQSINQKYVDFGDGNYLYLSWRLTEGDILYKDLPSPQPPLLLFVGAFWLKCMGGDPALLRLWQILQHCLTACCVWAIAARLFNRPMFSAGAMIIYLFLPEGVWWSAGFQSEPLLILLQCFNLVLFLPAVQKEKPTLALYGAAFINVLCCYTNMTALPYVALQWFFVALRFRKFLMPYSVSIVVPGMLLFTGLWFYSEGQYIDHVFFRQVGTYPTETITGMLTYFLGKLYVEGGDILFYEGAFVVATLAGLLLYSSENQKNPVVEYSLWWAIFSLGSIVFVTKGGTVEYIFTLGEPAVALFSAFFILTLFAAAEVSFSMRSLMSPIRLGTAILVICFFLPVFLMKPASLLYRTFSNKPLVLQHVNYMEKSVFELPGDEMEKASLLIQNYCPPGKTLIAPPYYAFLSKRKLAENSSSLFILAHAYFTEWESFRKSRDVPFALPGREEVRMYDKAMKYDTQGTYYNTQSVYDLAQLFERESSLQQKYPAIALFLNLRKQIINREVGLVVKNMRHFFFYVPPLHQAIRDFCTPLQTTLQLNNREEDIVFYQVK